MNKKNGNVLQDFLTGLLVLLAISIASASVALGISMRWGLDELPEAGKTIVPEEVPAPTDEAPQRPQQLIFDSEDQRTILDEWERIWFLDEPSDLKPYRTHGGII